MIYTMLLLASSQTRFWLGIVVLFVLGLGYLANKLTKGKTINYVYFVMNEKVKKTLIGIQGAGSLLLALILPNNYLNEIEFVRLLYKENELWIAGTMLILLFSFIILFGLTFSFVCKWLGLKREDDDTKRI